MAGEEKEKARKAFDRMVPEEAREHLRAAREAWRDSYESLLPPEYVKHRRAARREMLLAARSVIDAALERLEKRAEA